MSQVARISRPARHGYTRPAGRRCEATSIATNSCRTTTVSTTPMTIEINHAGKKDPRMLKDGDTPQPGRAMRLAAASERIGRPTVASEDVMRDLACASRARGRHIPPDREPSYGSMAYLVRRKPHSIVTKSGHYWSRRREREGASSRWRAQRPTGRCRPPSREAPYAPSPAPKRDSNILRCVHSDGNRLASSHLPPPSWAPRRPERVC